MFGFHRLIGKDVSQQIRRGLGLGIAAEHLGAVEAARAIEPICILWCIPGFLGNRWTHALKLLERK